MIKIEHVDKYYFKNKRNELHVVNNTCLDLPEKGLVTLLGPSGSGKTTLLNIIGGLDKAKGSFDYDGLKMKNYRMHQIDAFRQENIGYIFQNYNLILEETVSENLRIALEIINIIDPKEVEKRIEYTLKAVGMYKYRKKQAFALSGGQQQRVAIARALLKNAKIIIADEPTGNLDSENTIEVMNILKKISKTTLVLLVTHDVKIASFYSDKIVRIQDGKVISYEENSNVENLSTKISNHVYLKDLNYSEYQSDLGSIEVYNDQEETVKIDFQIIIKNDNIYIKSNQPIKLVENSNLKLIDDHYKDMSVEQLENIEYDTSWFMSTKASFKEHLLHFLKTLKMAFMKFRNVNKRNKIVYFAFLCLGIILGASVICTINFATADTSNYFYESHNYQIISKDHTFSENPIFNLKENYNDSMLLRPSVKEEKDYVKFTHKITFHKQILLQLNSYVLRYNPDNVNIICGNLPTSENEVIIDKANALLISKEYGNRATINQVIGKEIELHSNAGAIMKATIAGVTDQSQKAILVSDYFYTKWLCFREISYIGDNRYYKNEIDSEGNKLYEIVEGRDLLEAKDSPTMREVIVNCNTKEALDKPYININGLPYYIVGFYKYKDNTFHVNDNEHIINTPVYLSKKYSSIALNDDEYVLQKGRKPQNLNECMVSVYSNANIGSRVDGKEVVGIYVGTQAADSTISAITLDSFIFENSSYDKISFEVSNLSNFKINSDQMILTLFDNQKKESLENQASNLKIFELLSMILLIISALFLYLIMRSRMISDIYNIGVHRSLGAKRIRIIGRFMLDLIILTTFTSLIGYLLILFIYNISASSINSWLNENMLRINNGLFLLGLLGIYLLNIIIGLLPIILLLRKTPSEICSKYDI